MLENEAHILLNLIPGIGPSRASALIQACGSAAAIFDHDWQELSTIRGISQELAHKIQETAGSSMLDEELDRIALGGVHVYTRADADYPEQLRDLEDAPLCLYTCGVLPANLGSASIAIVGSRRATVYGMRMAQHIAESAAYSGWTVVSGLALGVDAAAHKGTMNANGKTVAVLGGGLMKIQPQEHVPLARDIIAKGGAVITEFPMTFPPTRHSFPMRNRIISALSLGTVVVEAGRHSGALITAAAALEQGKAVFAVPGNADSEQSSGCNELIRSSEAQLVTSFEDVLEAMDFLPGFAERDLPMMREENSEAHSFDEAVEISLPESDRKILDFLKSGEASFDAISAGTGIAAGELSRKLVALEISHKLKRTPNGYTRLR